MCNRFTLTYAEAEWLALELGVPVEAIPRIEPRYNIAPTNAFWIVRQRGEDRELHTEYRHIQAAPRIETRPAGIEKAPIGTGA